MIKFHLEFSRSSLHAEKSRFQSCLDFDIFSILLFSEVSQSLTRSIGEILVLLVLVDYRSERRSIKAGSELTLVAVISFSYPFFEVIFASCSCTKHLKPANHKSVSYCRLLCMSVLRECSILWTPIFFAWHNVLYGWRTYLLW